MRILVVEDNPSLREVVRWTLEHEGYEVVEAEDGGEALRLLLGEEGERRPERFDLVLTDLHLPVLSGAGLVERVRAGLEEPPPFIGMTAYHDLAQLEGQVARLLKKPFDLGDLLDAVTEALGDRGGGG